jgi:uncharacterized membrane-anchored protein
VSHARGGLDLGTGPVSLVLFAAIVVCVAVLSARDRAALKPVGVASRSLDDAADASRM